MAIGLMRHEELALGLESSADVLLAVDILLTAVDHADVPAAEWEQLVLKNFTSILSVTVKGMCWH